MPSVLHHARQLGKESMRILDVLQYVVAIHEIDAARLDGPRIRRIHQTEFVDERILVSTDVGIYSDYAASIASQILEMTTHSASVVDASPAPATEIEHGLPWLEKSPHARGERDSPVVPAVAAERDFRIDLTRIRRTHACEPSLPLMLRFVANND
jgi:hypothetical protein